MPGLARLTNSSPVYDYWAPVPALVISPLCARFRRFFITFFTLVRFSDVLSIVFGSDLENLNLHFWGGKLASDVKTLAERTEEFRVFRNVFALHKLAKTSPNFFRSRRALLSKKWAFSRLFQYYKLAALGKSAPTAPSRLPGYGFFPKFRQFLSLKPLTTLNFAPTHFYAHVSYKYSLDWFFLIGTLASPYSYSTNPTFLNIEDNPENLSFFKISKKKFKKKKILSNAQKLNSNFKLFYRKSVVHDFFYFRKAGLNTFLIFTLHYLMKFKVKKKKTPLATNRPYLFLYNNSNFKLSTFKLKFLHSKFRSFAKSFRLFKKHSYVSKRRVFAKNKFKKIAFTASRNYTCFIRAVYRTNLRARVPRLGARALYLRQNPVTHPTGLFKFLQKHDVRGWSTPLNPIFAAALRFVLRHRALGSKKTKIAAYSAFFNQLHRRRLLTAALRGGFSPKLAWNLTLRRRAIPRAGILKAKRFASHPRKTLSLVLRLRPIFRFWRAKLYRFRRLAMRAFFKRARSSARNFCAIWGFDRTRFGGFANPALAPSQALTFARDRKLCGLFEFFWKKKLKRQLLIFLEKSDRTAFPKLSDTPALAGTRPALILLKTLKNRSSALVDRLLSPILYKPVIVRTQHRSFLRFRTNGFLLTFAELPSEFTDIPTTHLLKKEIYAFSFKNEMQRYILRRYLKSRVFNHISSFGDLEEQCAIGEFGDTLFTTKLFSGWRSNCSSLNRPLRARLPKLSLSTSAGALDALKWDFLPDYVDSLLALESNYSIRRVRFKPGYMSLWREARAVVQTTLDVKFRYQHRLTKYLFQYYKYDKFQSFLIYEFRLKNVLLKTKLLPDAAFVSLFVNAGLVYINGFSCLNERFSVFLGDFIQLVVHAKYYIASRWLATWAIQKKMRFKFKIKNKMEYKFSEEDKQKTRVMPYWVLHTRDLFFDIPRYLEVDYFTLSAVVVYEPLFWDDINPYSFFNLKFGILNMYNWKYIT